MWDRRRILCEAWIGQATTPGDINLRFGLMRWLNTDRPQYCYTPESSFFALGTGADVVWAEPKHDLVVVVRWIEGHAVDDFIGKVLEAVEVRTAAGAEV